MSRSIGLQRNTFGRLELIDAQGNSHEGVIPVRAFPISAPGDGISLVNREGHEVVWIDRIGDLPADDRELIEEELATREFMPVIEALEHVSTFSTPSTWTVRTNRGHSEFVLPCAEDIRQLGAA